MKIISYLNTFVKYFTLVAALIALVHHSSFLLVQFGQPISLSQQGQVVYGAAVNAFGKDFNQAIGCYANLFFESLSFLLVQV